MKIIYKNGTNTDFMRIIIRKDWSVHGYTDIQKWNETIY